MNTTKLKGLLHNRYFIVSATVFGAFIFYVVAYFGLIRPMLKYEPVSNQTEAPSSETTPEATTADNQPADSSAGSSTPSTSTAKSNSTKPAPTSQQATPQPSSNKCSYTKIPSKQIWVSGSKGVVNGSDGYTQTCTYTDGRPPEIYSKAPVNTIVYLNTRSSDYNNAVNICNSVMSDRAYFNDCMAIAWEQ